MPALRSLLILVVLLLAAGQTPGEETKSTGVLRVRREVVTYYDRNGDRKVDLERHHIPHTADADWALFDDNYDGRYEYRVLYGFAVTQRPVSLRVPKGVKITKQD